LKINALTAAPEEKTLAGGQRPTSAESILPNKSDTGPGGKAPKPGSEGERRCREAEALRQNLLRRKAQQRSRQNPTKSLPKPLDEP
jgi:hypothetical protein